MDRAEDLYENVVAETIHDGPFDSNGCIASELALRLRPRDAVDRPNVNSFCRIEAARQKGSLRTLIGARASDGR